MREEKLQLRDYKNCLVNRVLIAAKKANVNRRLTFSDCFSCLDAKEESCFYFLLPCTYSLVVSGV